MWWGVWVCHHSERKPSCSSSGSVTYRVLRLSSKTGREAAVSGQVDTDAVESRGGAVTSSGILEKSRQDLFNI